jgi:hypothetical protein
LHYPIRKAVAIEFYGIELGDIVAIVALVVSAVVSALLFYYGHTRGKKSEQIRIGREIWDRIETQYQIIKDWILEREAVHHEPQSRKELRRAIRSLRNELRYFVYLTEEGEMKERLVLEYYRERMSEVQNNVRFINKLYADIRSYPEMQEILDLVKKYHILIGKIKEYEAQDSSI